jgi:hypothetical protein
LKESLPSKAGIFFVISEKKCPAGTRHFRKDVNMINKYKISYFTGVQDKSPKDFTIDQVVNLVRSSKSLKKICVELQGLKGKKLQSAFKVKNLPAVTVSGLFRGGHSATDLITHSGLIQVDIDTLDNISVVKRQLIEDSYTFIAFNSPSGTGIKLFVKIDGTNHLECFNGLKEHYKAKYSIKIDDACKDVCRLCFLSYDPEIFTNVESIVFKAAASDQAKLFISDMPTKDAQKRISDIDQLCQILESRSIDITNRNGYSEWRDIGFAIANGLGDHGRSYYHRISAIAHNYNQLDTDEQFTACCKNISGGRKWESLFGIAKDFNIVVNGSAKNQITQPEAIPVHAFPRFYDVCEITQRNGMKQFKGIEINELNFLKLLSAMGFRRFDIGNGFSFIKIVSNVIKEVQLQQIQDSFLRYLKTFPYQVEENVSREELTRITIKKIERLFGKTLLSVLAPVNDIKFNTDEKKSSFTYYKNGYVNCVAGSFSFHPYSELTKAIWEERIINRDFQKLSDSRQPLSESHGNYAKFIFNVAGGDSERFFSLCSLIGYLLHDYHEGKLKAVVLTDSKISDDNEGRTGKTLFGKALGHIRNVCELSGKDFKPDEKFKYQAAQLSSQIIFLNDAKRNFHLEALYNDITEGITIEKKNQSPVSIKLKYLITTNAIIKTQGASSRDRVIEFEFAEHYSDKYSPEDEFKQWFFKDWDANEWQMFDNFMMICISLYLENGLMQADEINIKKRKLISITSKQFFDFVVQGHIKDGSKFSVQKMQESFCEIFPEYIFHSKYPTRTFSGWLKNLPEYHEDFFGKKMVQAGKSGDDQYYIFEKINSEK